MKIDALKLVAFGPFTGKVLDFYGNGYGLHVVFGTNEAGKSTALRALEGLLFGFEHKVEDAWLHDYNALTVGGVLALADGGLLNLTRYKRRKNDLINEDTREPVDQTALDVILGRMGREAFRHAFGISHDSLRLGVESVLAAGGDLGHALFAATSGLNTLKRVMAKLDEQQSGLFSPRAKKAHINAGIAELNKLRKQQRDASAGHHQWKKMKKRLDDLQRCETEEIEHLEALTSEISLLSRYRDALKFVASRDQLEKDLRGLDRVPDLPDDFSQRRVKTQVAITQSREVEKHLTGQLADIDSKLEELTYDEKIIANDEFIKGLADAANIHIQAAVDGKVLRAKTYQHNESAQQALDLLKPGLDLNSVQELRLSKPEKGKIQRLGAKGAKLEEAVNSAHKGVRSSKANLKKAQTERDCLEKPKDTSALADCLARAAEYGKLEERVSDAEAQVASLKAQVDADLSALGLWNGNISELERLAIPTEETMRRFEADLADVNQALAHAEKDVVGIQEQLRRKEWALCELTQTRELPSIQDLMLRRDLRDRGWRSVRAVWLEGADADEDFVAAFPVSGNLAQAYEQSVVSADETADALRDDAEAVARADALRLEIGNRKEILDEVQVQKKALEKKRANLWNKWSTLWSVLGIETLTPREMIVWADKAGDLRRKAADLKERQVAANRLREDMDRIKSDMTTALEHITVNVPEKIGYAGLMELAGRTVQRHDALRQNRLALERRVTALEEEIDAGARRKEDAEHSLKGWSAQWGRAVSKLGLPKDARSEDVNDFILALDDVFLELEKAKEKQQRVDAIQRNRNAYAQRVAEAVVKLGADLKDLGPEAAAIELNARLAQDKERRQAHRLLEEAKREKHSAFLKEREKLAALEETFRLLCKAAHADRADRLPEIERQAAHKTKLLDKLDTINQRLLELASGRDLQDFVRQVKAHDPDELVAKMNRLETEKQEVVNKQKSVVREIALAEKELETIGGESLATAIAEEAEGLITQIQSNVEHYVKLRAASAILTKAMERYRQANQSPVLSAASQYFKNMTRGSFAGLRADFDDKGDPVIKASRPDGTVLNVQDMSDGSRDQLFLALRLGGLVKYIQNNGPMPFIVDDVLVHFDDERSAAALETMGELAEKTQIIFFTHHQHLVSLAKNTLPAGVAHFHRL